MRDAAAKLPCAPASLDGAYGVRDVCRVFMLDVCSMFKFLHGAFAALVQHKTLALLKFLCLPFLCAWLSARVLMPSIL